MYDSLHQNTRLSVLMTIAVFQYLETFPFSFLSVIPSVISLLCYVCSFSSIVNCLFLWTNKEPYEVAKYNTVFSSFAYLFSLYQRLRLEKDFSVFEDFLLFVNIDMQYNLWQCFPNLSWRTPCPASFVCLPYLTHMIQLISEDCKN